MGEGDAVGETVGEGRATIVSAVLALRAAPWQADSDIKSIRGIRRRSSIVAKNVR
jgi:hypothetical protein